MTLPNGDYIELENKVVQTLNQDSQPCGIRETENPAVALIEAGIRDEPKMYAKNELPAVAVCATGKTEQFEPNAKTIGKTFHLALLVIHRGADREQVENLVKKITARLEEIVRSQTGTESQFCGLPQQIHNAQGVLIATISQTSFTAQKSPTVNMDYTVTAEIKADLWIPIHMDIQ